MVLPAMVVSVGFCTGAIWVPCGCQHPTLSLVLGRYSVLLLGPLALPRIPLSASHCGGFACRVSLGSPFSKGSTPLDLRVLARAGPDTPKKSWTIRPTKKTISLGSVNDLSHGIANTNNVRRHNSTERKFDFCRHCCSRTKRDHSMARIGTNDLKEYRVSVYS